MAQRGFLRMANPDNPNYPSINLIEPGLYLGNRAAAMDHQILTDNNITHIVTVDTNPLPKEIENKYNITILQIPALDLPTEDLISYFDDAYSFITEGGRKGCVFVHCYFGISRSATIVIAFLMKKYNYTFSKAFKDVKDRRFMVGPNPGFVAQLELYYEMKCNLNKNNKEYRHFRLRNAADKYKYSGMFRLEYSDVIKPDPLSIQGKTEWSGFCCDSCGRFLISDDNLISHFIPNQRGVVCNESLTVEPLSWMEGVTTIQGGNINCPKCSTKIGFFSWVMELNCPCGYILYPFFKIYNTTVSWCSNYSNPIVSGQK